jgi:hypothetical protein
LDNIRPVQSNRAFRKATWEVESEIYGDDIFLKVFYRFVVLLLGDPWAYSDEMKERFGALNTVSEPDD